MGSENGMMIGSIVSAPVSKSSAASSYDIFSKTDAKQRKIDYENLPIKNIKKYSINCLKDDSDENVLASLGNSYFKYLWFIYKNKNRFS